ncbi:MAG: DUF4837 family protein [Bacteroidetes bacterium]|nr:DUF4837 family protein [Bacteroidota bacterium]
MKILGAILLIILCSCEWKKGSMASGEVAVTGKVGEILVVCDAGLWSSDLKTCLDSNLTQFIMPYFPDVATFDLIHKTPEHFTQGVKRYRNTLFLKIDTNYKEKFGKIEKRMGVWATDQLVVDIIASDYNQLVETCQKGLGAVHDEFDQVEWKRILKYYKRKPNEFIDKKVKSNFGIALDLPDQSKLVTSRKNFYRIEFPTAARPIEFVGAGKQDAGLIAAGILIYQYPFVDSSQFELKNLLQARDTMLRYNVPLDFEGMYMGTQYVKMVYPEGNIMTSTEHKVKGYEMRGMFQFVGAGKHGTGGAFWAFHFVNPKTNKLVCVSGYVDAPSTTSWTQSLREVQAILESIEIL